MATLSSKINELSGLATADQGTLADTAVQPNDSPAFATVTVTNITDGTDTVATGYVVNGSAKAWVNFNGTGTVAIRDSVNVASITDNGTGYYNINWSSAFSAADYAMTSNAQNGNAGDFNRVSSSMPFSTSYAPINVWAPSSTTVQDSVHAQAKAHGDLA